MKTKTKVLFIGNVIALAAAYYAGVVITSREMSTSPAKAKAPSAPVAMVAIL